MGRLARIVIPGMPHHATQRGNRRAQVFFNDQDRRHYLSLFRHYARRYALDVLAYCLMDNHVHWVVVPQRKPALAQSLREAHARYSEDFNRASHGSGHVFQGRFFSCPLDDEHLWAAVRYVERNPVRAKMVFRAEEWPWSSATGHCGLYDDPILTTALPAGHDVLDWSDWLKVEDTQQTERLRRRTRTGRPCGSLGFLAQLEALTGRILQPLKRGRKSRVSVPGQGQLFS